ncbi:hypothetical protein P154DRAFT_422272 [Amniculicola lignicola CBS 123094]|uniref:G-patch domain-containing protein n=1 Tax=Amniculicola lignicola CBS 123094 TaxID=1392246 RepID=A0A6A5X048_9PLEO|nr:hypothetical protein P154DRAFT_422272 [Amniculicola lignicola CBS 123094]
MDAAALLQSRGWRGKGHSLDKTGKGIKRPLLISIKQDQFGIGKKKQAHKTDDQWWLRAFDQSLQTFGTEEKSMLDDVRAQGVKSGGLYGWFVKGETIEGTISTPHDTSGDSSSAETPVVVVDCSESKKRKRDKEGKTDAVKKAKKSKADKEAKQQKKARKGDTGGWRRNRIGEEAEEELEEGEVPNSTPDRRQRHRHDRRI